MHVKTIVTLIVGILIFSTCDTQAMKLEHFHAVESKQTPKRVAHNFLNWYKDNRENLEKFKLITGKPGDSTTAYRVDFQEAEKYLSELKKSGFVSDQYIASFRKYFEEGDANLKKYPQYTGTAMGFGFDLVLKADDYKEILDHINKRKIITKPVDANTVKVYIRFPTVVMLLKMTKSGNTWLIDSLDYV
ncbi:MAG TPA: hypothetical protein VLZ28_03720 [Daejeonella sp.]|nr:hypothetical protein [Daejeonella sp.]